MNDLPGMPPLPDPDATKGCEHRCIRGLAPHGEEFYPCPTHRPEAFQRWSEGQYPGWRDAGTDARKASL